MSGTIEIINGLAIDENELEFSFVRASGPGGQNVNKVATAVQLRFDVLNSPSLPPGVRRRLANTVRLTNEGVLIIEARRHRTQAQNRDDAVERLVALIRAAARPPKRRKPTRPSRAAKQRRLEQKRRHGQKKEQRRPVDY